MRIISLLLTLTMVCAEDRPIHPLALNQIKCWISDNEEPTITQFSINAVNINRNQCDYSKVTVNENVVKWADGNESCSYTMIELGNGIRRYVLSHNSGGTLTEQDVIDGKIVEKIVIVKGENKTIKVFDVVAINPKGLTSR